MPVDSLPVDVLALVHPVSVLLCVLASLVAPSRLSTVVRKRVRLLRQSLWRLVLDVVVYPLMELGYQLTVLTKLFQDIHELLFASWHLCNVATELVLEPYLATVS